MDSDGLIMDDARRSSRVVPSGLEGYYYRQFFFNTSLDIQNLRVEDAGIYNCSMSINITYPDGPINSSSIVTNTTYFALWIRVPPPSITFAARLPPYSVNEPLVTTCLVNTVEGLSVPDVNIGWFDMYGQPITTNSRVTVGEVVAINATWFSRTITVLRLIGSDSGNYTCRSSITGSFYYSDESSAIEPLVVEGVPDDAFAPLVNTVNSMSQVLLEGESVTITFTIEADPQVVPEDIMWFFIQFGSNVTEYINMNSTIGDGRTQLQFSPDLLSLMLSNTSVYASGLYYIVATNLAGMGTNFTTVTVQSQPQVTLQPVDPSVVNDIQDMFTISASCSATGNPLPYITWSYTTTENVTYIFDPSFPQVNISSAVMNGVITSTIALMGTTTRDREGTLTCTASNGVANVSDSQMPYLAVRAQPVVSAAVTPTEGDDFTLTCNSSYSIPPPTFMWYRNGVQLDTSSAITIQSRSEVDEEGLYTYASDLTINDIQSSDSADYVCSVTQTDSRLSMPLSSSSDPFTVSVYIKPQVTFEPVDAYVLDDIEDMFTFVASCSATGNPVPNITWSLTNPDNVTYVLDPVSQQVDISRSVMNGEVTSTVTLTGVTISDRGRILTCMASNVVAEVSDSQMPLFALRAQPEVSAVRTNLTEGEEFTLICNSSYSIPPPTFKWTRDGVQLTSSSTVTIASSAEVGEDELYTYESELTVRPSQLSDSGDYTCVVTQNDPRLSTPLSRSSDAFTIAVNRFDDCATSNGTPRCQNGGECIDADGTYFCRCIGNFDGMNCEISASPKPPSVISGPTSNAFKVGSTVTLSCIVEGVPTPTITWLLNGLLSRDLLPVPNITFTVAPDNRGEYTCSAENDQGSVTSSPASISLNDIQQYEVGLSLSARRRRQSASSQTIQEIVDSTVGAPVGNMGVVVYSAMITSISADGNSATVLYTLRRPDGVEFAGGVTGALTATISSTSTAIVVATIRRFDGCSKEMASGYMWPETSLVPVNLQIELPCLCSSTDRDDIFQGGATRVCGGSFNSGADWQTPNTSACIFDTYVQQICNAAPADVFNAISSGVNMSTQAVNLSLSILTDALASTSPITLQTLDGAADAINALLIAHANPAIASELRRNGIPFVNNILEEIENLGNAIGGLSDDQTIDKSYLQVRYQNIPRTRLTDTATFTVEPGSPLVIFNSEVAALFSGDVPLALANVNSRSIGTQFRPSVTISKMLLSVSTGSVQVSKLSSNIQIIFPKETDNDNPVECIFWDPRLNSGYGNWSEVGCTVNRTEDGEGRCNCNHLSTFGILYGEPLPTVPPTSEPIEIFEVSVIIYIALIVSILILLFIIITYLLTEELRKEAQIVFINITLIAFYIAYIISSLARQFSEHGTTGERGCGFFSAFLQYSMLAYFFWTASEAVMFVMMSRNSNGKSPKFYILISALVCYLTPLVIVAISLGGYQYFLSGSFCRPTNWPFYFGFVAMFALIALFNLLMYLMAANALWKSKQIKHELKLNLAHHIIVVAILFFLFTVAWIFGLIGTSNSLTRSSYVAAQYIFSLLAILHSILTVVLHIMRSQEARKSWYGVITCNRHSKRSYSTAGDKPSRGETELTASCALPSGASAQEDTAPLTPTEKKPVENIYTPTPSEATGEGDMQAHEEHVKVNLAVEDDEDDRVVTSL